MKLISCYISSFGKLKDFSYQFNDGLNIINQENGWGKTTFAIFIKSMFYGLSDGKRGIAENQRKKYAPWNSTQKFGGSIKFSQDGKQFEIERFFGKKSSEDSVKLTDLSTGISNVENINWGNRIYKIDEQGFLSTTFFSQQDIAVKDNHSLAEKYSATCEVEQSKQFEKAIENLQSKAKTYSYSGDRGLIPQVSQQIFNLKNELEVQKQALNSIENISKEQSELQTKLDLLKDKNQNLNVKFKESCQIESVKIKYSQFCEVQSNISDIEKKVQNSNQILNNSNVTLQQVDKNEKLIKDLSIAIEKENIVREDIKNLTAQNDGKTENTSKVSKTLSYGVLIFALAMLILGVVIFVATSNLICLCLIGAAVILAVVGVILIYKVKPKTKNFPYQMLLQQKQQQYSDICIEINTLKTSVSEFLSKFSLPFGTKLERAIEIIRSALNDREQLAIQKDNLIQKLNDCKQFLLSSGCQIESDRVLYNNQQLSDIKNENLSEISKAIKVEIDQNLYTIKELEDKISANNLRINFLNQDAEKIYLTQEKIAQLTETLGEYKEDLRVYLLTIENLKKADENLKIKYREPLTKSLNKYLSLINGSEILGNIDINLNMNISNNGQSIDTDYYSKGYQDLFEICKRFALIDILFKEQKPFVVLDDPFSNFDKNKISNALELLKKIQNEYQIIYFVCHDSRAV